MTPAQMKALVMTTIHKMLGHTANDADILLAAFERVASESFNAGVEASAKHAKIAMGMAAIGPGKRDRVASAICGLKNPVPETVTEKIAREMMEPPLKRKGARK